MNKIILFIASVFLLSASPASAFSDEEIDIGDVQDTFEQINYCVRNRDTIGCRDLFTEKSASLYNRFTSYGFIGCLPKDAEYISQQKVGGGTIVRAGFSDGGKQRTTRLMFIESDEGWKLDVPSSLQMTIGKGWEEKLNLVEKIYLSMRDNMKIKIDCTMLRGLVKERDNL